jgi:hypothetical protein
MTQVRELVDVIAFDNMPVAVRRLSTDTALAGLVQLRDRPSMFGTAVQVTEWHPVNPPMVWSSGEQLLWQYVTALASQGEVNLGKLANQFWNSGYIILITEAFEAVCGLVAE